MEMAKDKVPEVKIHFLNSVITIRPFLEQDLDLILKFNNNLTMLRIEENLKVSEAA